MYQLRKQNIIQDQIEGGNAKCMILQLDPLYSKVACTTVETAMLYTMLYICDSAELYRQLVSPPEHTI